MPRSFREFFLEKYVIGLIEPVYVEGIGVIEAKVDSGNGGYNVIHGEEIQIQGNKVFFKTVGNKRILRPMIDKVVINVGAGHQEERPVVEFNIRVGDRDFHNVKFSVGNRSGNEHKILICKDFIEGELDALVDVGATNISDRLIEVDYVGVDPIKR